MSEPADLLKMIEAKLSQGQLDDGLDVELPRLIHLLSRSIEKNISIPGAVVDGLCALLKLPSPKLISMQMLRQEMALAVWRRDGSWSGLIIRISNGAPVSCMLLGLFCSVAVIVAGAAVYFLFLQGSLNQFVVMKETALIALLLAALLGGAVSLLMRVDDFGALSVYDPFLVFANAFSRPIIALIFSAAVYAIFATGLLKIDDIDFNGDGIVSISADWVLGFLSGFSERFAADVVSRAENVIASPSRSTTATTARGRRRS